MSDLQQPLTPADCNLRGFQWMPIDVVRLLDSDLFLIASGDEFKAALALWCKSWSQVPAASLPADERLLAGLSGAGAKWKKVRDVAMRGWVMCTDGRWYHPVVAEKALEAQVIAKQHADAKHATNERKRLEREDRQRMFSLLREHNIVPDFHTKTSELRELVRNLPGANVTRDKSHAVTAKTGQDQTEPDQTGQDRTAITSSAPDGAGGEAPPDLVAAAVAIAAHGRDLSDDEEKLLWNAALALLVPSYGLGTGSPKTKDSKARMFVGGLGKRLKDAGVPGDRRALFDVIQAACVERPANPETWLSAAVAQRCGTRMKAGAMSDAQRQAVNDEANAEALRLLGIGGATGGGATGGGEVVDAG